MKNRLNPPILPPNGHIDFYLADWRNNLDKITYGLHVEVKRALCEIVIDKLTKKDFMTDVLKKQLYDVLDEQCMPFKFRRNDNRVFKKCTKCSKFGGHIKSPKDRRIFPDPRGLPYLKCPSCGNLETINK